MQAKNDTALTFLLIVKSITMSVLTVKDDPNKPVYEGKEESGTLQNLFNLMISL